MSTDDSKTGMTSSQPYLIRAMYEWIIDNELTPYLMVDGSKEGAVVPEDYLGEDGRIILNISPSATSELLMNNEEITFSARFSGQSMGIVVPTHCVRAIYARENGQGMIFDESESRGAVDNGAPKKAPVSLEAVASGDAVESERLDADHDDSIQAEPDSPEEKPQPGKSKKGPHLRIVK